MTREIPLTRGMFALVDDADYERLSQYAWRAISNGVGSKTFYAVTGQRRFVTMHQMVLPPEPGKEVDHRDRNGLNNQIANLRLATRAQNMANRSMRVGVSGYRGVTPHRGRYRAKLMAAGRRIFVGDFDDPIAAAAAWDRAAKVHHGEFANLNFGADRDWLLPYPEPAKAQLRALGAIR